MRASAPRSCPQWLDRVSDRLKQPADSRRLTDGRSAASSPPSCPSILHPRTRGESVRCNRKLGGTAHSSDLWTKAGQEMSSDRVDGWKKVIRSDPGDLREQALERGPVIFDGGAKLELTWLKAPKNEEPPKTSIRLREDRIEGTTGIVEELEDFGLDVEGMEVSLRGRSACLDKQRAFFSECEDHENLCPPNGPHFSCKGAVRQPPRRPVKSKIERGGYRR